MKKNKRICLLLAALLSLSGVQPATAADYQASDYLPLAVGNSWTYEHEYYDHKFAGGGLDPYSAYYDTLWANFETGPLRSRFTIEVLNTEVIGSTPIEFADALIPTGIPSSWGQIKQSWLAGERSGQ